MMIQLRRGSYQWLWLITGARGVSKMAKKSDDVICERSLIWAWETNGSKSIRNNIWTSYTCSGTRMIRMINIRIKMLQCFMSILHTSTLLKMKFPMYSFIFFVGKYWTDNTWLFQQPQVIFLVCFPMIGTFLKQRSISQDFVITKYFTKDFKVFKKFL